MQVMIALMHTNAKQYFFLKERALVIRVFHWEKLNESSFEI